MLHSRRAFLAAAAALASGTAARRGPSASPPAPSPPAPLDLEIRDIPVEGIGRRFVLLVPRHLAPGERVPLLVPLHGLGETGDPRTGAFAWLERYGLGAAYDRLRRPPVRRTSKRADWTDPRVRELNADLASH